MDTEHATLQEMASSNMSFPADGGASLFFPSTAQLTQVDGKPTMSLTEEELMKGGAAGIVQTLLEETVKLALELYPPPKRWLPPPPSLSLLILVAVKASRPGKSWWVSLRWNFTPCQREPPPPHTPLPPPPQGIAAFSGIGVIKPVLQNPPPLPLFPSQVSALEYYTHFPAKSCRKSSDDTLCAA